VSERKHEAESGDAKELAEILGRMRPKKAAKFYLELRAMRSNTPTPLPAVAPANVVLAEVSEEETARIAKMCEEDAANLEARRARKAGH